MIRLPRIYPRIVQQLASLIISSPFQNVNQRHDSLRSRFRAILRFVLRAEIRLRETRIIRKNFDSNRSVFNPLARSDHAQRSFARSILYLLDFVEGRGRIKTAIDGARSAGDVYDSRGSSRFSKERRECTGHDSGPGCVRVEGFPHLLAQWRGKRSYAGIVDENVEFAMIALDRRRCTLDGVVVGDIYLDHFHGARQVPRLQFFDRGVASLERSGSH